MGQYSKKISYLILGTSIGVDIIPTCQNMFKLSPPKALIEEVLIPLTNKNMTEGGVVMAYG